MSGYMKLVNKALECDRKARETTDVNLKIFYLNVAKGYRAKLVKAIDNAGAKA